MQQALHAPYCACSTRVFRLGHYELHQLLNGREKEEGIESSLFHYKWIDLSKAKSY